MLATFKSKLRLFTNKDIAILTSKSTIDFEEIGFIKEKYKLSFNVENCLINDILNEKKIIFKDRTTIHFEEIISIEYEEF